MPQVFQVLKCYKCSAFQIHQAKKLNKFECKMCGEKQTIKRHYGIGTGKDCRLHVQNLNALQGEKEKNSSSCNYNFDDLDSTDIPIEPVLQNMSTPYLAIKSKWAAFVHQQEEDRKPCDRSECIGDKQVLLDVPVKPKRMPKVDSRQNLNSSEENKPNDRILIKSYNAGNYIADKHKRILCNSGDIHNYNIANKQTHMGTILNPTNGLVGNTKIDMSNHKRKSQEIPFQAGSNSSKWAHFVNTEEEEEHKSNGVSNIIDKNVYNLFSLCDDNDLDEVLDF